MKRQRGAGHERVGARHRLDGSTGRRLMPRRRARISIVMQDHDRVGEQLHYLVSQIIPGTEIPDRRLSEAVLRLLGVAVRLHEEHAPDKRGRCVM